ncbi:MAG: tRNA 2-thiouridine(34) synthase MnmA [Gammaproteobacteria bacterium RIFCSPHIGHO2_12_FULL_43_28]|nr:MAG: tRNA 2-thiouridine(34) synthase MnmA [Gammaproteobacteria bacterium RIFCSPHIGHO2_12_FULL_43_28]
MRISSKKHIIVGMSGGVDSSVAAYLLKKAGHHVEGVFMKNWEGDDRDNYCPAALDMADAESVAERLHIDLHMVNFANEYWERVFAHFLDEYRAGRTPNPDILCNKEIKFAAFLDYARQRGADFIATGHYARISQHKAETQLLKGLDDQKDQSYFLHALSSDQLSQSLFPVGDLPKPIVREIAKEQGFENHNKKDSTGICFIGERKFKTFLNDYLPAKPGKIETLEGEVIGTHDGLMFYTIGQRQGLQIGGRKDKAELPWYVAEKDLVRNVLIVVQGIDHPALLKQTLKASLHWINGAPPQGIALAAKTRYRQSDQACRIESLSGTSCLVQFNEPQRAVTPGQSVVFYQGDICLGGGIIDV